MFPEIYTYLKLLKRTGHNKVAILLQGIEADFIFNFCDKHLVCNSYFTKHDAVYVKASDYIEVKELFISELNKVGFTWIRNIIESKQEDIESIKLCNLYISINERSKHRSYIPLMLVDARAGVCSYDLYLENHHYLLGNNPDTS